MKTSELFLSIKNDLEALSAYVSFIRQKVKDETGSNTIGSIMTRYNYENLIEILGKSSVDPDFEIDDEKLRDFRHRIGYFMDTYAPGENDLKTYITGISIYLAFIVKRPLHSPGLDFGNNMRVVKTGDSYYCGGKRQFIKDDQSLCVYCVCKSSR
jgi:Uncharacterized protein conserved in archaea